MIRCQSRWRTGQPSQCQPSIDEHRDRHKNVPLVFSCCGVLNVSSSLRDNFSADLLSFTVVGLLVLAEYNDSAHA